MDRQQARIPALVTKITAAAGHLAQRADQTLLDISPVESTSSNDAIRVLVADDDEAEAALIREHLESLGYAVDRASDGDHAIAMAATGEYQVMLLDVHMSVYRGVEVMRRLHLLTGRPLRVIAVTADRLASRRQELARMGVDGYLAKPIDLRRLQQELTRVLRRSSP